MKKILSVLMTIMMLVTLSGCIVDSSAHSGVEDGVLTIAMECAYAPYNWTQTDDSNGAVPIKDTNDFANGYDVMIAKRICEANGWELEVVRSDWDSLVPSVQTGVIDAVIAGQSMTKERSEQVDFAGPYYYATFAILVKDSSPLARLLQSRTLVVTRALLNQLLFGILIVYLKWMVPRFKRLLNQLLQ